ncbi:MAG: hypothetical protein ABI315_13810 [Bacteroidia bacterium]
MENDLHTTELDNVIKDALSNYKTIVEPADWIRVENALTVTPKKTSLNWKAGVIVVILIGALIGGYFLYIQFPFTLSISKSTVTKSSEKVTPLPSKKINTPTTTSPALNTPVVVNTDSINNALEKTITEGSDSIVSGKSINSIEETPIVTTKSSKTEKEVTTSSVEKISKKQADAKTETKKTDKTVSTSTPDQNKNTVTKIETPTITDSDKTAPVEKTPPKEEVSKTTPKTTTPKATAPSSAGWNTLMFSNINADSLKKYRERIKKDSIK